MSEDFQFDYSPMEALINEKITGRKSERNREILKLRFLHGRHHRIIEAEALAAPAAVDGFPKLERMILRLFSRKSHLNGITKKTVI